MASLDLAPVPVFGLSVRLLRAVPGRHLYLGLLLMKRDGFDAIAVFTAAAMAGLLFLYVTARALVHFVIGMFPIPLLLVVWLVFLLVVRFRRTRRALRARVRVSVLAPDSFDPSMDGVLRFASQLSRGPDGWFERRAKAVRITLDASPDGQLRYSLTVPRASLPALRSALSAYDRVQIRPVEDASSARRGGGMWISRCELRLARPSFEPLVHLALEPDPLQGFASVIGEMNRRLDEGVEVAIDLLPVTPGERGRLRRRLFRQAHRATRDQTSWQEIVFGQRPRGRGSAAEMVEGRAEREEVFSKLGHSDPVFRTQVLLRCSSRAPGRAVNHMNGLLACFDSFAAANYFRVAGLGFLFWWIAGSDSPGLRWWFDRRMESGLFFPARKNVLTAKEIVGLLKPPTVNCRSENVLRLGPAVHPAPKTLPTFRGQRNLLPLGIVRGSSGERMVGVDLADTFFSYVAGRSRFGKTELAIVQFLHLVRSGHGGMFIDPHEDALARIKSCLTEHELAERVLELDLTGPRSHKGQPGWNLLAVKGLSAERREQRVEAVVDAFASALGWSERNNRALTITTHATAALAELATILPDELAPTIFQLSTLLSNEEWRATVLPHLAPIRREFFSHRLERMSDEAITPVTNLIDRLRASTPLTALLGSAETSYDIARAMDTGRIVLACPGAGGARDKLVANLLLYDLLHTAKARAHTPPERRRAFYVFADEIQTYDGASGGTLAGLLEQTAKYGIRAVLCNQNPERLTPTTLNALTTNRSHLFTTALNSHAAGLIAREWGGEPNADAITHLPRHTFLAQVTHQGELTSPFLINTLAVTDVYPDAYKPHQASEIQPIIDQATGRRKARETITRLETLDEQIKDHLTSTGLLSGGESQGEELGARVIVRDLPAPPTRQ
jgi:hypothetical protein